MMNFKKEQLLKIKAVILYVLRYFPAGVDYIHLFKIMYFSQRQHLVTYGLPLIDESFSARKHGPVPEYTYQALRTLDKKTGGCYNQYRWVASSIDILIENGHPIFRLKEGVQYDPDELSVSNIEILDAEIKRCKDIPAFKLSELSHDDIAYLRAWRRFEETGEESLIPMIEIAEAGGASKEMQQVIRERLWIQNTLEQ